jgi:diphthamide biosynthesis enzyme Dph1/Dph2-like protein
MDLDYDLELDKVAAEIATLKVKSPKVCLQLPDGLKLYAAEILDELNKKLRVNNNKKVQLYIWAGSNFGACDVPLQLKDLDFDLVVNFGHLVFRRKSLK